MTLNSYTINLQKKLFFVTTKNYKICNLLHCNVKKFMKEFVCDKQIHNTFLKFIKKNIYSRDFEKTKHCTIQEWQYKHFFFKKRKSCGSNLNYLKFRVKLNKFKYVIREKLHDGLWQVWFGSGMLCYHVEFVSLDKYNILYWNYLICLVGVPKFT